MPGYSGNYQWLWLPIAWAKICHRCISIQPLQYVHTQKAMALSWDVTHHRRRTSGSVKLRLWGHQKRKDLVDKKTLRIQWLWHWLDLWNVRSSLNYEHNGVGSASILVPLLPAEGYMEALYFPHVSHTFSLSTTAVLVWDRTMDKQLWSAPASPLLGSPSYTHSFHIQAICSKSC